MTTFDKIRQWADDRGIYTHGTIFGQMDKLVEEFEELIDGLDNRDPEEVKDAVGDMVVVLTNVAHLSNLSIEDCIDHAYDQIKDRKGHMNEAGVFVKEEA